MDDAREIGALARRYRPTVVVLDLVLPTTDGVTAIAQLRQAPETAGLPVMLITGYLERLGPARAQIGDDPRVAFLPKPFTIGELHAAVRQAMGSGS